MHITKSGMSWALNGMFFFLKVFFFFNLTNLNDYLTNYTQAHNPNQPRWVQQSTQCHITTTDTGTINLNITTPPMTVLCSTQWWCNGGLWIAILMFYFFWILSIVFRLPTNYNDGDQCTKTALPLCQVLPWCVKMAAPAPAGMTGEGQGLETGMSWALNRPHGTTSMVFSPTTTAVVLERCE